MSEMEKKGFFYLGKIFDPLTSTEKTPLYYDSSYLTTHAMCVGMTGSGKTGLGIVLLEEAALNEIPSIVIDPKGDLGNIALTFPDLNPADFLPWIDASEAARKDKTPEQYAESIAETWKKGIEKWGMDEERIAKFKASVETTIYTPASKAGRSLSILNSFKAPSAEILEDSEAIRDRVLSTTSSLLGLIGIEADPINSREHILISTIIDKSWRDGVDLDIPKLIQQIQKPPFEMLGILDIDTFFPKKDRVALSMKLNNLLASPGFQAWMEGEPLDIQNLLYSKEGKPKLSVITIAHLSDSERMFFVTLLLNEVLTWMRRQSGTSRLRALIYMDEIFGYFPPTAMPPSKLPMLTLLKQARAFGLGVVLATQNPVDLDYKGLSNCGTWFIGKLQTERDRNRVIDGLNAASNGNLNSETLNKMIALCGQRIFILRSIYLKDPLLFETRWTMSYLRGPLTLTQIKTLNIGRSSIGEVNPSPQQNVILNETKQEAKVNAPNGIQEFYRLPQNKNVALILEPKVLGIAKLHFVDTKSRIDYWREYVLEAPFSKTDEAALWDQGEDVSSIFSGFDKEPPSHASFSNIPPALLRPKNFTKFAKDLLEYLYQNETLDLFEAKDLNIFSQATESEKDFRDRIADQLKEKTESQIQKIQDKYGSKLKLLQDRIQRYQEKAETKKSSVFWQMINTFISFLTMIVGAFFGRGMSRETINQAGTSFRRAGRITKEQQDVTRVEDSLESLKTQLQELQIQMENEVDSISNNFNPEKILLEKISIRPRKSDIDIQQIALVWRPAIT